MAEQTTRDDARDAIRSALLTWQASGVTDPTICVYADEDGDGLYDVFGLDTFGRLELRPGVAPEATVAEADGSGVEGGGLVVSSLRFAAGEKLDGSTIRGALERASDELVRRGYPAITVVSGDRWYETQVGIFRARYVPASQVNGRKVYDFAMWEGVLWARISSAGRVAPPSRNAPHVAYIAADLGYPYNAYTTARTVLVQIVVQWRLPIANRGVDFGEVWHWESTAGAGSISSGSGSGAGGNPLNPQEGMT